MKMTIEGHKIKGSGWPKIQTIKHIRYLSNLGLKEAKEITDKLEEGISSIVEFNPMDGKSLDDMEVRDAIKAIKDVDIKIRIQLPQNEQEKELDACVSRAINLCVETKKADILEILAVAFKMLQGD